MTGLEGRKKKRKNSSRKAAENHWGKKKEKTRHWLEERTKQKESCKVQEGLKASEDSFSKQ